MDAVAILCGHPAAGQRRFTLHGKTDAPSSLHLLDDNIRSLLANQRVAVSFTPT
jgi:hypothetical protein